MFISKLTCSVFILLAVSDFVLSDSGLPNEIQKCKRDDNKCIQEVVQYIANNYPNGLDTIGLPAIEPLHVKKFDMVHEVDEEDDLNINWKAKNLDFNGFSKSTYTVGGFENNLADSNVTVRIDIPEFIVTGDYTLRIKFKKRPSHGSGRFTLNFNSPSIVISFKPEIYEKHGKNYMKTSGLTVQHIIQKTDVEFNGLFDGNKELADLENKHFSEHGTHFIELASPVILPNWVRVFTELFENVLAKYPINEMFLD